MSILARAVPLETWHDFFVVAGTAAGALTGLQFVVIALNQGPRNPGAYKAVRSYATPTIVHFAAVLVLASVLSFPNLTRAELGAILLVVGIVALAYTAFIFVNDRRQEIYMADLEDTIWHFTLPPLAYGNLLAAGVFAWSSPGRSLYMIGASMLALLVVGVHNAWDSAIWMTFRGSQQDRGSEEEATPATPK